MHSWKRSTVAGGLFAAVAVMATLGAPWAFADEDLDYEEDLWHDAESWVEHAECTFFGEAREDFLSVGLGAQLMAMQRQAELNAAVTAAMPSQSAGRRSPRRSRSGSMAALQVDDGPIQGSSIDDFVFGQLERKGIAPAAQSDDLEFLRRVTLDLTGRIPTLQEVVGFLQDGSADKRQGTVERLLASGQWADRWTMFFGDMLRNTTRTAQVNRYPSGRDALHLYIRDAMRDNMPYDQLVGGVVGAYGANDGREWPPTLSRQSPFDSFNAYRAFLAGTPVQATASSYLVGGLTTGGPIQDTYDTLAAFVARDFLGISHMDCILCHDGASHLDSLSIWGEQAKRAEGWGLAAFFQRVELQRPRYRVPPNPNGNAALGPRPRYWYVNILGPGERGGQRRQAGVYAINTTGGNRPAREASDNAGEAFATPKYPFGGGTPQFREAYGDALARLLTADRQFARNAANRIWGVFFSRGIVEPVTQFDLNRLDPLNPPEGPWTIQPSHPELLEFLTDGFISNGFDLKWLMREIVSSDAYQLSSRYEGAWSPSYEQYFARHPVRRLTAEEAHDAVVIATGAQASYVTTAAIGRVQFAMQLPDVVESPPGNARRPEALLANSFLDAFFRGDREETPRSAEVSILQALHLMNNPTLVNRVQQSSNNGTLAQLAQENDDSFVGLLYVAALGRLATPEERVAGVAYLNTGDRRQKAEDLLWALMNSVEFVFNH